MKYLDFYQKLIDEIEDSVRSGKTDEQAELDTKAKYAMLGKAACEKLGT